MTITAILVQAEPGREANARLKCAADLADQLGAVVVGLGAQVLPASAGLQPLAAFEAEWLVAMRDQVEADLRGAEQAFRACMAGRPAQWRTRRIPPDEAMATGARVADLIVAGGVVGPGRGAAASADVARLILTAGRPVLVAPPEGERVKGETIVVAWKDCREARRAVADAMPLLQRAKEVLVVDVCRTVDLAAAQEAAAEVAQALSLHGVNARGEAVERDDQSVAEVLLERARWLGADLIVSGAYGHSRISELALGGVTRDLLAQDEVFVLFAH